MNVVAPGPDYLTGPWTIVVNFLATVVTVNRVNQCSFCKRMKERNSKAQLIKNNKQGVCQILHYAVVDRALEKSY